MTRPLNRPRPGQALVEFAMVVPILLLLVFGIIEFGRAWQTYQTLTNVAREGARRSVVLTKSSATDAEAATAMGEVTDAINASLRRASLDPVRAKVSFEVASGDRFPGATGSPVKVQVDYEFEFILIGRLIGRDKINISTSSVMRKE